jgi:hypothetical protein
MNVGHPTKRARPRISLAFRIAPVVAGIPAVIAAAPSVARANLYAYAETDATGTQYFQGAADRWWSSDFEVADPSNQFADNDTWIGDGSAWIEAGMIYGAFDGVCYESGQCSQIETSSPKFFYGYTTDGTNYQAHVGSSGTPAMNTTYRTSIVNHGITDGSRAAESSWDVTLQADSDSGPTYLSGQVTGEFTKADSMAAGTETTTQAVDLCSFQGYLSYWGHSDNENAWGGGNGTTVTHVTGNPPGFHWVYPYTEADEYLNSNVSCPT